MSGRFSEMTFPQQVELLEASAERGEDPSELLRACAALPDPEPLARYLRALQRQGALEGSGAALAVVFDGLSDVSIRAVFETLDAPETLAHLAEGALERWPVAKATALAYLLRWLRRRAPARHAAFEAHVAARLEAGDARALLFCSGDVLATSEHVPEAARQGLIADVMDAIAGAPKSLSQSNAERLLAQDVYADDHHFLFELLQNADDAGARHWSIEAGDGEVSVRHDGRPFSLLDVVGITSIGLSTKRARQIGQFGVGFKSVYSVTERPRVHSGALHFEIAQVSVPRRIGAIDTARETRLTLPLKPSVSAEHILQSAAAIPPETLMTLPNVRSVRVQRAAAWTAHPEEGRCNLVSDAPGEGPRSYATGLCDEALAAVRLDGGLQPSGGRVFAFLPTRERSGLRFLLHAPFGLTVDRERIDESPKNAELLRAAGHAFIEAITGEGDCLPVMPAPGEAQGPFVETAKAIWAQAREMPCIPSQEGELVPPEHARFTAPALRDALGGVNLGDEARRVHLAAELAPRERALAAHLGARELDASELLAFAERALAEAAEAPSWLGPAFYDAIASSPRERLRRLPMLRSIGLGLIPAEGARIASAELAAIYAS
ncbi:MAG: hypothetical protein AAF411_28865, partial [Myxococcota bacterium]